MPCVLFLNEQRKEVLQKWILQHLIVVKALSGKRDSNSRPQPWQGCALPTELFPQNVKRRRLELPRRNWHYPLKVARLPIPPPLHSCYATHCFNQHQGVGLNNQRVFELASVLASRLRVQRYNDFLNLPSVLPRNLLKSLFFRLFWWKNQPSSGKYAMIYPQSVIRFWAYFIRWLSRWLIGG